MKNTNFPNSAEFQQLNRSQMKKVKGGYDPGGICDYVATNPCWIHDAAWTGALGYPDLDSASAGVTTSKPYYCCSSCVDSCNTAHGN